MSRVEIVLRRLVPLELERALFAATQQNPDLVAAPSEIESFRVDLSGLTWIDLGAAAQLVVYVDWLARYVQAVQVDLPSPTSSASDPDLHRRASSERFLRYVRFREAIEYIARKRRADVRVVGPVQVSASGAEDFPETYRRVVPLHWIASRNATLRSNIAQHMTQALRNSGEGVDGPDAQALSNVILYELIQNVAEHAQAGDAALVCGFAHAKITVASQSEFLPEELPFLAATQVTMQPFLEAIVADSGSGIVASLQSSFRKGPGQHQKNLTRNGKALPHNVIRWAFDRWSTEKEGTSRGRGVRGLFRVDRLVAKYFGQVSVRTGNAVFVRDHVLTGPPIERFNRIPQRHFYQPGTFLRVRMTGVSVPGIRDLISRYHKPSEDGQLVSLVDRGEPRVVVVEALCETGFTSATEDELTVLLSHSSSRPQALYVQFPSSAGGVRSTELALRFLSSHGSPVPIYALNLGCSLDELDTISEALNAECEDATASVDGLASKSEQLDPVMALHESGAVRWIGVPAKVADIIGNVEPGGAVQIPTERLSLVLKVQSQLRPFFELASAAPGSSDRCLRCIASLRPFNEHVERSFRESLRMANAWPRRPDEERTGPYLTPTLNFVKNWMRIDLLVPSLDEPIFEGIAFELARKVRARFADGLANSIEPLRSLLIWIEERSSDRVGKALTERFSLVPVSTPGDARVDITVPTLKDVPVIVYADLVSSGESVRRAAQMVLRRAYSIAAVVALVDARKDETDNIEAFGRKIPLISLFRFPNEAGTPTRFSVVSPSLLHLEQRSVSATDLSRAEQFHRQQEEHIWEALVFRHMTRHSGRHLTLTIDQPRLLGSTKFEELLRTTILRSHIYRQLSRDDSIVVLCPLDEHDAIWRPAVTKAFATLNLPCSISVEFVIRTTLGKSQALEPLSGVGKEIGKSRMVIVFDWGVITGKTLDFLSTGAVEEGAEAVLAIIGNSQLSKAELQFRKSITSLRSLSGKIVPFEFQVLNSLPLGHYASAADCPVCAQATELLALPCPDEFIAEYRTSALRRLQNGDPSDPPLASRVLDYIAALRAMLVAAQTRTSARFAFQQQVLKASRSESSLDPLHLALVELLYVEGSWVQLPPVRYRACRDPISEICMTAIERGSSDTRAKAISVLRRISKQEFVKSAPRIFAWLGKQARPQGALLFGLQTYIERRYHENMTMLEPVIEALGKLKAQMDAHQRADADYPRVRESIRYLTFQAEFLSSRAGARGQDPVAALMQLRELFSEPNYHAHGQHNQAIERLLSRQFLAALRKFLHDEHKKSPSNPDPLPAELTEPLKLRVQAWLDVRRFLAIKVVGLASAARPIFESRMFQQFPALEADAQWFLRLLDLHSAGMAPELAPDALFGELQRRQESEQSGVMSAGQLIELLDASELELNRLLTVVLRAKQEGQPGRPGVEPAALKVFLDGIEANLYECLQDAVGELRRHHGLQVDLSMQAETSPGQYSVCCQATLLREAAIELLLNVAKHGTAPEQGMAAAYVLCELSDKAATVKVVNHHVKRRQSRTSTGLHGLDLFKRDIASFGGTLEVEELDSLFTVKLTVRRWR